MQPPEPPAAPSEDQLQQDGAGESPAAKWRVQVATYRQPQHVADDAYEATQALDPAELIAATQDTIDLVAAAQGRAAACEIRVGELQNQLMKAKVELAEEQQARVEAVRAVGTAKSQLNEAREQLREWQTEAGQLQVNVTTLEQQLSLLQ